MFRHSSGSLIGRAVEYVAPVSTARLIDSIQGSRLKFLKMRDGALLRQILRLSGLLMNWALCGSMGRGVSTCKSLSAADAADTFKAVLDGADVPLIIWGCGDEEKDNEVLMECSQAAKGEKCLIGSATESNYRTLAALGTADGHDLIGEAPVDINIAKQVNILLQDAGFDLNNVVMCQVTAALGYGFDYVYTIFERVRIAGLKGDALMALPQIANVGWEVWKVKEAIADEDVLPGWGKLEQRGPQWEAATAAGYLQAGADILVLAHPDAVKITAETINEMMAD